MVTTPCCDHVGMLRESVTVTRRQFVEVVVDEDEGFIVLVCLSLSLSLTGYLGLVWFGLVFFCCCDRDLVLYLCRLVRLRFLFGVVFV